METKSNKKNSAKRKKFQIREKICAVCFAQNIKCKKNVPKIKTFVKSKELKL